MSSDVSWHIRDKLWPMQKHGSIILYVHGNQKARYDGQLRTSTSTLTQLLNYDSKCVTVAFYSAFWKSAEVVYVQRCLIVTWLVPRRPAAVSAHVLCTSYNHPPCYDTSCKATYSIIIIIRSVVFRLKCLNVYVVYGLKPFYFVHCMCLYIFLQLFVRRIVP